jgi:hypothetical protein
MTKFSDVIGATHTIGSNFWRYGSTAKPGMKELAEHGATDMLENELKEMVCLHLKLPRVKLFSLKFHIKIKYTFLSIPN